MQNKTSLQGTSFSICWRLRRRFLRTRPIWYLGWLALLNEAIFFGGWKNYIKILWTHVWFPCDGCLGVFVAVHRHLQYPHHFSWVFFEVWGSFILGMAGALLLGGPKVAHGSHSSDSMLCCWVLALAPVCWVRSTLGRKPENSHQPCLIYFKYAPFDVHFEMCKTWSYQDFSPLYQSVSTMGSITPMEPWSFQKLSASSPVAWFEFELITAAAQDSKRLRRWTFVCQNHRFSQLILVDGLEHEYDFPQ